MYKFTHFGYTRSISPHHYFELEYGEVLINIDMIESVAPNYFNIGKRETKTEGGFFGKKEVTEIVTDYQVKTYLVTMHSGDKFYFKEDPTLLKQLEESE